ASKTFRHPASSTTFLAPCRCPARPSAPASRNGASGTHGKSAQRVLSPADRLPGGGRAHPAQLLLPPELRVGRAAGRIIPLVVDGGQLYAAGSKHAGAARAGGAHARGIVRRSQHRNPAEAVAGSARPLHPAEPQREPRRPRPAAAPAV